MHIQDISEVMAGLVLLGKRNPDSVNPELMTEPFGEIIRQARQDKDSAEIMDVVGTGPVTAALMAAKSVPEKTNWDMLLEKSAARFQAAQRLSKIVKRLERGDDADIAEAIAALAALEDGLHTFTALSDIKPDKNIWRLTYWQPLDKHLGGIPKTGLTVVGASPGVGKTSLLVKLAVGAAKMGQDTAIFSLEMTAQQLLSRLLDIEKLTLQERGHIYVCDEVIGPAEVYSRASQFVASHPTYMIGIDFADLMIEGEESEPVMGMIYRMMANLAKKTRTPVVLLSQLNRAAYTGGIPRIHHLRWSGLAEALSSLILLVYNPTTIWASVAEDKALAAVPNAGWIIAGKSRYGFKEGGPGAILVNWDGKTAWGNKSLEWRSLGNV